jgi:hypothetical protein
LTRRARAGRRSWPAALLSLAAVAAVVLVTPGVASADDQGPNCGPGWTLGQYRQSLDDPYDGCVYDITNFAQPAGDFLRVSVYAPGFDALRSNAVDNAVANWNTSGAHLRLARVSSTGYPNLITIATDNFGADCATSAWAKSWGGTAGDALRYRISLNAQTLGCTANPDTWTALIGHELGHNLGLFHNSHFNGPLQPMMRGATQAKFLEGDPIKQATFTDLSLINALYPQVPRRCAASPGDDNCNGMDPVDQGCADAVGPPRITVPGAGWVELHYSSNCGANWAKATTTAAGWHIYRILVERQSGPDGRALSIEDAPWSTFYYGNMLHSPNNIAHACVTFRSDAGGSTGRYCTNWF